VKRTFKAYFKMPTTKATVIIINTSPERLKPAMDELKAKGLIFIRTNFQRAECSKCNFLTKHAIDDIEQWCEKKMFEKFPYKPIFDCPYYEPKTVK